MFGDKPVTLIYGPGPSVVVMPAPDTEHEVVPLASVNINVILVVVTDVINGAVNALGLAVAPYITEFKPVLTVVIFVPGTGAYRNTLPLV